MGCARASPRGTAGLRRSRGRLWRAGLLRAPSSPFGSGSRASPRRTAGERPSHLRGPGAQPSRELPRRFQPARLPRALPARCESGRARRIGALRRVPIARAPLRSVPRRENALRGSAPNGGRRAVVPALDAEETAGNGAGRRRAERCGGRGRAPGCGNAPTVGCGRHGCGGRPYCAGCRHGAVLRGRCCPVRGRLSFRQSAVLCLRPRRDLIKDIVLASDSHCSLSKTSEENNFFIYTAITIKKKKKHL